MKKLSDALSFCVYIVCYSLGRLLICLPFPVRTTGAESVPKTGGVLILATHQSYLDPMLIGLTSKRQCRYLARSSLFRFPPFRWLIRALGAIPLDRDGVAKEGLKKALEAVNNGDMVLIFPEGTRTTDGEIQEVKPGVLLLVRRSEAKLVVAGIEGAFESWPRNQKLPSPRPIFIHYQTLERSAEKMEQPEELEYIRQGLVRAKQQAKEHRNRLYGHKSTPESAKKDDGSLT